jgi:flagellar motor protein MotB
LLYLAERERAKAQHAAAARGEKLIAGGSMSFEEELKWAGMWSLRSNLEELGKALAVRFAELQERENAPEQLPQPQPQPFQPPQKSRTTPEERQHLDELIESMDLDDSLD